MSGYNNTFYDSCMHSHDGISADQVYLCGGSSGAPSETLQEAIEELRNLIAGTIGLQVTSTTPTSSKVKVGEGQYRSLNGRRIITRSEIVSQEFAPIVSLPRIDLLCLDDNGNLSIVMGAEASMPVAPLYPTDRLTIAEIRIDETTEVFITEQDIQNVHDVVGPSTAYEVDGGSF